MASRKRERRILVARHGGFCPGVRRGLDIARRAARGGPVASLGELVHNSRVVEELKRQGVRPVEGEMEVWEGKVIIRTHGVPPQMLQRARGHGLSVIDATCPWVKRAQRKARQLVREGYEVFVIGQKEHPEVVGIIGWTGGSARVVETAQEARALPPLGKAGIVCQTTITDDTFGEIAKVILQKSREAKVFNTTCRSTRDTQCEAAEMAAEADLMLVLGSPKSANTRHLLEVCRAAGAETILVEEASEVTEEMVAGWRCIGITGGASCPKELIQEVEDRVRRLTGAELVETRS